jgi:protein-S-isoprenylcysteine O-methyltransferase Ste14
MSFWFVVFTIGFLAAIPLNFLSVEHTKLEKKYGPQRGKKIGEWLGYLSGWGLFGSWIGIWFAPQPHLPLLLTTNPLVWIPFLDLTIYLELVILGSPLILVGMWLGIRGVQDLGLKVAETHRPEELVTTGIYNRIRHPQYVGGFLAHLGISILLAAWYSLLLTPAVLIGISLISWKEDVELAKEFPSQFKKYQNTVPTFFRRRKPNSTL